MQYPIAGLFCLELFALSVALMVIFGDSLATIFPSVSADSFKIMAFCLVLPTVFMPFQILSYTSLIGLVSSLTLVGAVVFDGLVKEDAPGSIFHPAKTSLSPSHRWGLSAGLMMSGVSGTPCIILLIMSLSLTRI
jgi:vesicular inhibitory amino acid transporter